MDPKFKPRALIFDLMGTCCDWYSSVLSALKECPPKPLKAQDLPKLAADWRVGFFKEIHSRFKAGLPAEDIDVTHRRVLDELLDGLYVPLDTWDGPVRNRLVAQWHHQRGSHLIL